jgi:hypothetical protein
MLRWPIVAVVALLLVPGSANAQGQSESVTSGDVTATLTWTPGAVAGVAGARLAITRAGVVAFDAAIPDVVCDGCTLPGNGADDVKLVDLDGLGEPEAIVTAVDGCCSQAGIYSFNTGTGTYDELVNPFGSTGFNLDDLDSDGRPEIVAQDSRLEPLMSLSTLSMTPPRVLIFLRQDEVPLLADVTTKYRNLVRPHASRVKRALAKARSSRDRSALITSYVADQYLLGHGSTGLRELDRQIRNGKLGSAATAKRFRRHLLATLKADGYR